MSWARSAWLLVAVLAAGGGCSFDSGASGGSRDGSVADRDGGGDDGGSDGGDDCESWNPATPFDPCEVSPRGGNLELTLDGTYLYDTMSDELTFEGGPNISHQSALINAGSIRIISAGHLEIGQLAKLRVTGNVPLLFVVWGRADVIGTIDVSSSAITGEGAGANPVECDDGAPTPGGGGTGATGGGGGGGGALGGDGGPGGFGGGALPGTGGDGGTAVTGDPGLRGGCPGTRGGTILTGGTAATRGSGGGAVAISARVAIDVQGVIHAGGAGGNGAVSDESGGGGGAGSGGLVWLDAPAITLGDPCVLAANGGGGGEGADNNDAGDPGDPGKASRMSAPGGSSGGNDGGNGGAGSDDNTPDGTMGGNGGTDSGGGGGGGGAGITRLDGTLTDDGATISPPATPF